VVCLATVAAIILSQPAQAITIRVPQDYAKIQSAINAAHDGDEIVVSSGVYVEIINFMGKNIVLRSTDPMSTATIAATVIDGNKKGAVVAFAGTETSGCLLTGFTIRNGIGGIYGGGAKARIERNTITGNSAYGPGGGLYDCDGTIQNNTISGNSVSTGSGGGLYDCDGTIQNNVITNNSASGGFGGSGGGLSSCNGTIQNNVITSNSASGNVYGYGGGLDDCKGPIRNNTITSNSAKTEGGGLWGCTGVIVNCIIWGNTARVYSQVSYDSIPNYSCIQGYTVGQGQGNIGANPRFVGPNDFHLRPDSPCIDAGTNANSPATDKDGSPRPVDGNGDGRAVCDMGAYEYVPPRPAAVPPRLWRHYR
jgi:hypothetical protein